MMGNNQQEVPDIVVARLPVYLRALSAMHASGKQYTSSHELAQWLGISSAQIRKDLSHFGEFGKQGTGYSVTGLYEQLRQILHLNREWPLIVVGAGHIGSAVASYSGFAQRGFRVIGVFDNDPGKVGAKVGLFTVGDNKDIPAFVKENHVLHAMIAVPAEHAQQVADLLVASGITGILNYAPINLSVPPRVRVEYIDPVLHLQKMTYYLE
jgi:redox-sensing transcriptional repressor